MRRDPPSIIPVNGRGDPDPAYAARYAAEQRRKDREYADWAYGPGWEDRDPDTRTDRVNGRGDPVW